MSGRSRHLALVLSVIGCLASSPASPAAAATPAADRLALQRTDLVGFAVGPPTRAAALRRLAVALVGKKPAAGATIDAAAYRRGSARASTAVVIQALRFRAPATPRVALLRWKALERKAHRAARVERVGDAALSTTTVTRTAIAVTVALRRGAAFATVRVALSTSPRNVAAVRRLALAYALQESLRLQGVLTRTAWDRVAREVRKDGSMSRATLVRFIALAWGPLPGIKLPAGRRRIPRGSGTTLLHDMLGVVGSLPLAQRVAIERGLKPRHRRRVRLSAALARAARRAGCRAVWDGVAFDAASSATMTRLRDAIAADAVDVADAPTYRICVYDRTDDPGVSQYAVTEEWWGDLASAPWQWDDTHRPVRGPLDAAFDRCITYTGPSFASLTPANRQTTLGHEAYHCLSHEYRNRHGLGFNPQWVEDGLATWAGNQVARGTYLPATGAPGLYHDWFSRIEPALGRSLFQYEYAGFGFFSLAEQESGPGQLWSQMTTIWAAQSGSRAVYELAVGSFEAALLRDWASGYWRSALWSTAWNLRLPFDEPLPGGHEAADQVLAPVGAVAANAPPYTARRVEVVASPTYPLVELTLEGRGRVTDGLHDWTEPQGEWYCLGVCECPPGQEELNPIPPSHPVDSGTLYVGLASSETSSKLRAVGHSMVEYCRKPLPTGPRAQSLGDPHLTTFDGLHYDFQGVGEYVLARSLDGAFEVQARQSNRKPGDSAPFSRFVSMNQAVAMRVGGARLVFTALGGTSHSVRLNGLSITLAPGESRAVGTGGALAYTETRELSGYDVTWPDGSHAHLEIWPAWGVALTLEPAAGLGGKLRGLLGNDDGSPANDLATRAGGRVTYDLGTVRDGFATLAIPVASTLTYAELYTTVGDSRRVTDATSLFDYAAGQTTATVTDRTLPVKVEPRVPTPEQLAAARAACLAVGLTDPEAIDDCVFDVARTSDTGFAEAAAAMRRRQLVWKPVPALAGAGAVELASTPDGVAHAIGHVPTGALGPFNEPLYDVRHVPLAPDGTVGAPSTVLAATPQTRSLTDVAPDGSLRVTVPSADENADAAFVSATAPASGSPWTRGPDTVASPGYNTALYDQAIDGTGRLWSLIAGVRLVRGLGAPAATAPLVANASCNGLAPTQPRLTADAATVYLTYAAWGQTCAPRGFLLARFAVASGAPSGDQTVVPGSTYTEGGVAHSVAEDTLVTASTAQVVRPQGGTYVVFQVPTDTTRRGGYGNPFRIMLWKVGAAAPIAVAVAGEYVVALSARVEAASGRIWIGWADASSTPRRFHAVRTNAGATAIDPGRLDIDPPPALTELQRGFRGSWSLAARPGGIGVAYAAAVDGAAPASVWFGLARP